MVWGSHHLYGVSVEIRDRNGSSSRLQFPRIPTQIPMYSRWEWRVWDKNSRSCYKWSNLNCDQYYFCHKIWEFFSEFPKTILFVGLFLPLIFLLKFWSLRGIVFYATRKFLDCHLQMVDFLHCVSELYSLDVCWRLLLENIILLALDISDLICRLMFMASVAPVIIVIWL